MRDKRRQARYTAFPLTDHPTKSLQGLIGRISAGEPIEIVGESEEIDLNYLLSRGSENVLVIRVEGQSMSDDVRDGDWIIVALDRQPQPNDIIIASVNGDYTLKRIKQNHRGKNGLYLVPANPDFKPREMLPANDYSIVGVVIGLGRKFV